MQTIQIKIHIPVEVALAVGRAQHGETTYALTDADVAALSDEGRALVAGSLVGLLPAPIPDGRMRESLTSDVATVDGPTVVRLIEARAAARAEWTRAKVAEIEARIASALAAPPSDWISGARVGGDAYYTHEDGTLTTSRSGVCHTRPEVDRCPRGLYLAPTERADPRIVAHVERLTERALPAAVAAWQARHDEWAAGVAAREASDLAERERHASLVRAYVLACVPDYRRAAEEGVDITRVGERAAREAVESAIETAGASAGHGRDGAMIGGWHAREPREVATTQAYETRDALRELVTSTIASLEPTLRALCGEPAYTIERLDRCPRRGCADWVTCAVATIPVAGGEVECAMLAEDASGPHEHREESESED